MSQYGPTMPQYDDLMRSLSTFQSSLQSFTEHVHNSVDRLASQALYQSKASVDDFQDVLHELQQKEDMLEHELEQNVRVAVNTMSLAELAGHFMRLYEADRKRIQRLEEHLMQYGYQRPPNATLEPSLEELTGTCGAVSERSPSFDSGASDTSGGREHKNWDLKHYLRGHNLDAGAPSQAAPPAPRAAVLHVPAAQPAAPHQQQQPAVHHQPPTHHHQPAALNQQPAAEEQSQQQRQQGQGHGQGHRLDEYTLSRPASAHTSEQGEEEDEDWLARISPDAYFDGGANTTLATARAAPPAATRPATSPPPNPPSPEPEMSIPPFELPSPTITHAPAQPSPSSSVPSSGPSPPPLECCVSPAPPERSASPVINPLYGAHRSPATSMEDSLAQATMFRSVQVLPSMASALAGGPVPAPDSSMKDSPPRGVLATFDGPVDSSVSASPLVPGPSMASPNPSITGPEPSAAFPLSPLTGSPADSPTPPSADLPARYTYVPALSPATIALFKSYGIDVGNDPAPPAPQPAPTPTPAPPSARPSTSYRPSATASSTISPPGSTGPTTTSRIRALGQACAASAATPRTSTTSTLNAPGSTSVRRNTTTYAPTAAAGSAVKAQSSMRASCPTFRSSNKTPSYLSGFMSPLRQQAPPDLLTPRRTPSHSLVPAPARTPRSTTRTALTDAAATAQAARARRQSVVDASKAAIASPAAASQPLRPSTTATTATRSSLSGLPTKSPAAATLGVPRRVPAKTPGGVKAGAGGVAETPRTRLLRRPLTSLDNTMEA